MSKFLIHTMGCKSNKFESSLILENLISHGWENVNKLEDADFYILNSCSVTHKSDNEAMYLLRNAKHKKSGIINVVTGCMAQIEKENLLKSEYVDYVIGNDEKLKMFEVLENLKISENKCLASDIMSLCEFNSIHLTDTSQTRASLKIQDGCDNRCTYCIIPFARGTSRSAKPDFIINEIKNLETKGFKEVVFTGIHIGLWGKEFGLSLVDLLKEVEEKTSIPRYRLGSLNPHEITDELLEFLKNSKKFCPHFHLSLQSACDKTLRSMNRFYKVEEYLAQIVRINEIFDKPFLGSDIIVGFAGEDDFDFDITRKNLEKSGLSQIHTFPYSKRQGTVGAGLEAQNSDEVKNSRADIVKSISRQKYAEFVEKNLGCTAEVLIEKRPDKKTGFMKGMTRNYLTVLLDTKDTSIANTLQQAKIKRFESGKIFGKLI